jgi:hypothetical protein
MERKPIRELVQNKEIQGEKEVRLVFLLGTHYDKENIQELRKIFDSSKPDLFMVEGTPSMKFEAMLRGEKSVDQYITEVEASKEMKPFYELCIELSKNMEVKRFDPFHTPTVEPKTYNERMLLHEETERSKMTAEREDGYQNIDGYVSSAKDYAKARARENIPMDKMFSDAIVKEIGKMKDGGVIFIKLAAGHTEVPHSIVNNNELKEVKVSMKFIGENVVNGIFENETEFIKSTKFLYSPLEELVRKYRFGKLPLEDKNLSRKEKLSAETEADLLAAREFISNHIAYVIKPKTSFPKLERDTEAAKIVYRLSIKDCEKLAEMIYLKSGEEALGIVQEYIKNKSLSQ